MFVALDLHPLDHSIKPDTIVLHPLLASYHLDDLSLPIPFPVNAQAQLRVQDGRPVIYCRHSSCDASLNDVPAVKSPRRVSTGDTLKISSSDASMSITATYRIQVAYFAFSLDPPEEVAVDHTRLQSGAELAMHTDTTFQMPLFLPLTGNLPSPAPRETNWDGIRALVDPVRLQSAEDAVCRQKQEDGTGPRALSSSKALDSDSVSTAPRPYAQLIAHLTASPPPSVVHDASPSSNGTSPHTSVLPGGSLASSSAPSIHVTPHSLPSDLSPQTSVSTSPLARSPTCSFTQCSCSFPSTAPMTAPSPVELFAARPPPASTLTTASQPLPSPLPALASAAVQSHDGKQASRDGSPMRRPHAGCGGTLSSAYLALERVRSALMASVQERLVRSITLKPRDIRPSTSSPLPNQPSMSASSSNVGGNGLACSPTSPPTGGTASCRFPASPAPSRLQSIMVAMNRLADASRRVTSCSLESPSFKHTLAPGLSHAGAHGAHPLPLHPP
ncbi:hypothetical protein CF319_g7776 [Tilletia indica]|nr:hypothetical protein CF319_g7776 [Tilletia indica]